MGHLWTGSSCGGPGQHLADAEPAKLLSEDKHGGPCMSASVMSYAYASIFSACSQSHYLLATQRQDHGPPALGSLFLGGIDGIGNSEIQGSTVFLGS